MPRQRKPKAADVAPSTAVAVPQATAPKDKGGRPEHEPTPHQRAQVKMLAAMACSIAEIALFLRLSEPTIRKHYADDVQLGKIEAKSKVAAALYKAATDSAKPNVVAAIFWLKTQAGWREDAGLPLTPPARPAAPAPEPIGKKAAADLVAQTATLGSDWQDLLGRAAPPPVQ
jgi:DNA-binding CsgD family transcriptional regulator